MEALEETPESLGIVILADQVNRYPGLGETVVASTAPYGFKGLS